MAGKEVKVHMERHYASRFWPETGTVGAIVVPLQKDVSTVLARVIDDVAVGDAKALGVIQSGSRPEQLVASVISARTAIPKDSLERGVLTSDQFVAMTEVAARVYDSQVYSPDMPTANETRVSELAAKLCRSTDLDGLVIAEAPDSADALADELPLLKRLAESHSLSVLLSLSDDAGGTGELGSNLATAFAWVERLKEEE